MPCNCILFPDSWAKSGEYFARGDYCMALGRNGLVVPSRHERPDVNNAFPVEDLRRLVVVGFVRVEIFGLRCSLSTIRTGLLCRIDRGEIVAWSTCNLTFFVCVCHSFCTNQWIQFRWFLFHFSSHHRLRFPFVNNSL